MMQGLVFDVKRYAIHDGDGIRTTIFLKGCPLACKWCHNPEGIKRGKELGYVETSCIHCGGCIDKCPNHALEMKAGRIFINSNCVMCGQCVDLCPTNSLKLFGVETSLDELKEILEKDRAFYNTSNGGITFSGGEVFGQPAFLLEALKLCKEMELNTAIETSLFTSYVYIKSVIPYIDQFIVDIKIMDSKEHEKYTGVKNELILENIKKIAHEDVNVLLRTPLIPGITATRSNLEAIGRFIKMLPRTINLELLNYNPLAESKYSLLGDDYKLGKLNPYTEAQVTEFYNIVEKA